MKNRILWLENDAGWITDYVERLREEGYDVSVAPSVTEAESLLSELTFTLMILDIMIPLRDDDEANRYSPTDTDFGYSTGFAFYERHKKELEDRGILVLVFTVRLDMDIANRFFKAGLRADLYKTKVELSDIHDFITYINSISRPNTT